jgi:hypothetical protein
MIADMNKQNNTCERSSPEAKPEKKRMSRAEKINAWLTAAIFVATGASAVIFYFQWQEMKGASSQTAQIIEKSGKQVEATEKLATVQSRIARPYVGIFVSNARQDKAAKIMEFMIVLRNFGGTPGTHFLAKWRVKIGGKIEPPHAPFKQEPGIIFPGQDESFHGSIGSRDFDDVVSDKKSVDIEIVAIDRGPDEEEYKYCAKQHYLGGANVFYTTATEGCTLTPK